MAVSRWMDQCDHPGIDRAVLFRDRRLGDQIPDRVYQGKWKNAGGRRIFFGVYLRWSIHGTLFYPVLSVHSDDHLRRGAKRNRTCIEIYDADTDRVIRPDCGVFRDKTGRHGGSKIFSCAKCEKLFLDDGGSGDGTDVLFAVDCNGNPHYLWILYEKRNITGRFHKKCGSVCYYGGTDDHSGGVLIFGRRPGYSAGGTGIDVYYDSKSV